jgi:hypothetical protein
MTYQIAYGLETECLEDPDQLALLTLPDGAADLEYEDLVSYINDNWGTDLVKDQPLVGLDDIIESFQLALRAAGVDDVSITDITNTVTDAVSNNLL